MQGRAGQGRAGQGRAWTYPRPWLLAPAGSSGLQLLQRRLQASRRVPPVLQYVTQDAVLRSAIAQREHRTFVIESRVRCGLLPARRAAVGCCGLLRMLFTVV